MNRKASVTLALLLSCAAPVTHRTIEPVSNTGGDTGDEGFVLSKPRSENVEAPGNIPLHLEGRWFPYRADYLGIREDQARQRDEAISVTAAPEGFWDQQTAIEAVSIWSALCNECHGGRRKVQDAVGMPPSPLGWGTGEGLFFGARRPYRDIYGVIFGGGPTRDGVPSEMPAWKEKLSREQIWGLIYFLEFQSGGIEGRFPPSLYPRGPSSSGD